MKWLKHSGIWIGIVINPFHWKPGFSFIGPSDMDPALSGFYISLGPVWIRAVIDDGSW